ncbi:hypothetical protein HU200_007807 [Digitaria exilis]|uniref:Uncharacterized protein n=1 Tax=Digitaria exilis TaxID=1010633 RepID=A0A835KQV4_9POAL|nr:hypothetical protein HU200_007807 [Digitaria exilis]
MHALEWRAGQAVTLGPQPLMAERAHPRPHLLSWHVPPIQAIKHELRPLPLHHSRTSAMITHNRTYGAMEVPEIDDGDLLVELLDATLAAEDGDQQLGFASDVDGCWIDSQELSGAIHTHQDFEDCPLDAILSDFEEYGSPEPYVDDTLEWAETADAGMGPFTGGCMGDWYMDGMAMAMGWEEEDEEGGEGSAFSFEPCYGGEAGTEQVYGGTRDPPPRLWYEVAGGSDCLHHRQANFAVLHSPTTPAAHHPLLQPRPPSPTSESIRYRKPAVPRGAEGVQDPKIEDRKKGSYEGSGARVCRPSVAGTAEWRFSLVFLWPHSLSRAMLHRRHVLPRQYATAV